MSDLSKYPFLRMLIPFALGIWTRVFFASLQIPSLVLVAVMLALFAVAVAASVLLKRRRFAWLFGSIMACYLFIAGFALTRAHDAVVQKDFYRNYESDAKYYVARVYDYPSERENNFKVPLRLEYQFGDSLPSRAVSGLVMAYFQKSDSAFALRYGDLIAVVAPIGEVSPPKNPEEFDYQSYLMRKGITGQCFLRDNDWIDLQTNKANPVYAFAFRFRDYLMASLQRCGVKDKEFGVAAAILLGYDESLADDIRRHYVAAGSMHILCVSGMHVGVIYLVASFLLGFLNRKLWQKRLKHLLLLAIIWFYALITGLSPSILRAALMITIVIIGEMIRRKGFIINSIASSAFILLCVNPNNLFEIGFQLSYVAVIGIVVLQKPIYHLIFVKNKLLDKVWEITSVALAAQLATLPFTLFYFHQFTTYFWLSNLFMTPISFFVVMGGMLLLLVSWIPFVNVLFGYVVWGMIYVMDYLVLWIDGLPLSIIKGLYVSPFEFALLLTAFVLLLLLVSIRKKRMVFELLAVMLLFVVSITVRLYRADKQDSMVCFSLRKHTAVDFVKGEQHILLADTALIADVSTVDYSLSGFWTRQNLTSHPKVVGLEEDFDGPFMRKSSNLVSFEGKLLALWDDSWAVGDSLTYRLPVDYMLVMGRQKPDVQSVVNGFEAKLLLIDGTVPRYLAEQWMAQAEALHLPYHDLGTCALEVKME